MLPLLTGITEAVRQVTSYSKRFEVGSVHLIRGKTTISPVDRDTPERQHGLPKAAPFRNGNRLDQVPFYGFMGNVSIHTSAFAQAHSFSSDSGCRKECFLVSKSFDVFVLKANSVCQFHDHREHQRHEEIWARVTGVLLLRL